MSTVDDSERINYLLRRVEELEKRGGWLMSYNPVKRGLSIFAYWFVINLIINFILGLLAYMLGGGAGGGSF